MVVDYPRDHDCFLSKVPSPLSSDDSQDDLPRSVAGLTKLVRAPRFAEGKNTIDHRHESARVDDLGDLLELRATRLRANDRSPDTEFFGFLFRRRLD